MLFHTVEYDNIIVGDTVRIHLGYWYRKVSQRRRICSLKKVFVVIQPHQWTSLEERNFAASFSQQH